MAKISKRIAISAAFVVASLMSGQAGAMPVGASGKAALERIDLVAQVQYSYGGQSYCWYDDGWNGPGWYVCGQYTVRGVGWGGGAGWHGWTHSGTAAGGTVVRGGTARRGTVTTGGGARVGGGRTGGGRVGGGGTGGGRTGGHASGRTGGGRAGGGRTGGGRTGGRGGGGRRSDVLLKHDVVLLGRLDNGLGFYRFSYNGSEKAYVGVMAQEVQMAMPEAVVRGSDGYLRVRYDALGVKFQTYDRWLASGAIVPSGLPRRH